MSQSTNRKMLKGRDLITVGIFSAIYFVASLVAAMIGAFLAKGMFKKHFTKAGIV